MGDNFWAFLNERKSPYWKGFSNKDRNIAIYEIENLINKYGFISEFHMFSDLEISINIQVEGEKVFMLYNELKTVVELNDFKDEQFVLKQTYTVMLNITFLHSTGKLRIEVPSVPG